MRPFLTSDDVMAITGYSRSQAYLIISELNRELKKQGYMTRRGCVPSLSLIHISEPTRH